jgi:hypothetical protein
MLRENNTEGPKFNNGRVIISMCILLYWNWFLLGVWPISVENVNFCGCNRKKS